MYISLCISWKPAINPIIIIIIIIIEMFRFVNTCLWKNAGTR